MAHEQDIDLNNLSQRELLILLLRRVDILEKKVEMIGTENTQMKIEQAVFKTKLQFGSALIGFAAGLLSSVIVMFLAKFIA